MPTYLLSMLSEVPDPRRAQGKVYALGPVLLFAVLAMLAGAKSYRQIHSFIKLHRERLNAGFGLAWRRTPAYTSVRGILQGLNPADLERVFRVHSRELWRPASDAPPLIAIDGKTLRRSFDSFNDRKAAEAAVCQLPGVREVHAALTAHEAKAPPSLKIGGHPKPQAAPRNFFR